MTFLSCSIALPPAGDMIGMVIEEEMPMLSFASAERANLSFNLELETHHHGISTILDFAGRKLRKEISTTPLAKKDRGFITGVASVQRRIAKEKSSEKNQSKFVM